MLKDYSKDFKALLLPNSVKDFVHFGSMIVISLKCQSFISISCIALRSRSQLFCG